MNEVELEELRRDAILDHKEEAEEESRLHSDYFYAQEQLVEPQLAEIYEQLTAIALSVNSYGWHTTVQDLLDELKAQ